MLASNHFVLMEADLYEEYLTHLHVLTLDQGCWFYMVLNSEDPIEKIDRFGTTSWYKFGNVIRTITIHKQGNLLTD